MAKTQEQYRQALSNIFYQGIGVKAKDIENAESNWVTFEVSMPKNKLQFNLFFWFLEKLFERFPMLEQIFLK